jgi:hypothetical protein
VHMWSYCGVLTSGPTFYSRFATQVLNSLLSDLLYARVRSHDVWWLHNYFLKPRSCDKLQIVPVGPIFALTLKR